MNSGNWPIAIYHIGTIINERLHHRENSSRLKINLRYPNANLRRREVKSSLEQILLRKICSKIAQENEKGFKRFFKVRQRSQNQQVQYSQIINVNVHKLR